QLGLDTRIRDNAQGGSGLSDAQAFYVNWDAQGLRMTWTGADWDMDGDLFIYLDTRAGGTNQAYDPYSYGFGETKVLLPVKRTALRNAAETSPRMALQATATTPMEADYLIWMTDSYSAQLLAWNSTDQNWEEISGDWTYNLDWMIFPPHTDIYVPFTTLAITNPTATSLSMVAFASDDYELSLWATMPARNPVNSSRLVDYVAPTGLNNFALTQAYAWPSLGLGVCPNGTQSAAQLQRYGVRATTLQPEVQFTGADVALRLEAEPAGIAYSVLSDDYFFLMDDLDAFEEWSDWDTLDDEYCAWFPEDPECERETGAKPPTAMLRAKNVTTANDLDFNAEQGLNTVIDTENPPVGDGNTITYTIRYSNQGIVTATGLVADIITWGPVLLPDGDYYSDEYGEYYNLVLELGDLAPGETAVVTFTGEIDLTFDVDNFEGWATLDIIFYDDTGNLFEDQLDWFYIDHEVDTTPPSVFINDHPALLGPEENTVEGLVFDASPVPWIELEIEDWEEITTTVVCEDTIPDDGKWDCTFDLGGAAEGDPYYLSAVGEDVFGQVGEPMFYTTFLVDAMPPTVTLSFATESTLDDGVLGPDDLVLTGALVDNRQVAAVEVCDVDNNCVYADFQTDTDAITETVHTYDDAPASSLPIGASTACASGTPIKRTFVVTEDFTIGEVAVGINMTHAFRYDVSAQLIAPSGEWAEILWDGTDAENYDVLLYDTAPVANTDDEEDHDPAAPYYDNARRPDDALAIFKGESAQGTWQLVICDYFPDEDDGAYNRSQLVLTSEFMPENTSTAWSYTVPDVSGLDSVARALDVYGLDSVGNRTTALALNFNVDTVAPVITVTSALTRVQQAITMTVMQGWVADGGDIQAIYVVGVAPTGTAFREQVTSDAATGAWIYRLQQYAPGTYTYWVQAEDIAGNIAEVGPYTVKVLGNPLLSKVVSPMIGVQLGSTVVYTLTLSNPNGESLEGVTLRDELPLGMRPLTQTAGTAYLPPVGNTLTWGPYTVPSGATWVLAFSAVVTDNIIYAGATLTNTAYVTSTNFGAAVATAAINIAESRLLITKTVLTAQTPVQLGDRITYTVIISNSGTATADNVAVTDTLPEGVRGTDLVWTGSLAVGELREFTLPAVVTTTDVYAGRSIVNTASLTHAGSTLTARATFTITGSSPSHAIYLPLVMKQ
ncbi:MAG: DUF11 domain-containing protein, partial [Anaerolineae bacterium]|nr:DUF11 domain-containing protein [Anaerolineae bacterium]